MLAERLYGFKVETCKSCSQMIRFFRCVHNGHQYTGTGGTRRTAANGIDHHECSTRLFQLILYGIPVQQFLKAMLGQFLLHGLYYFYWIHNSKISAKLLISN